MITDPHDKTRQFRQYVQFNKDGSVASVHEFEMNALAMPHAVEVTDFGRQDFSAMSIHPDVVAKLHAAADGLVTPDLTPEAASRALLSHAVASANVKAALASVIARGEPKA